MGKKGLDELLSNGNGEGSGNADPPGTPMAGDDVAARPPAENEDHRAGLLDPITRELDDEQTFTFLSQLVEYIGDTLVNIIDHYNLELAKVENAMSVIQGTVMNQIHTIRNQVSLARQQGDLASKKPPSFPVPGQLPIQAQTATPAKRREATEKDVLDIAASIRQLVTRQKGAKEPAKPTAAAPPAASASPAPVTPATIDSKVSQYRDSSQAQKARVSAMTKPTTIAPASKPRKEKKPTTARPPRTKPAKEKDFLPAGFHDELMKNIKTLMKGQGKENDDGEED